MEYIHTQNKIIENCNLYNGKPIDLDGKFGNQCPEAVRYMFKLSCGFSFPTMASAKDFLNPSIYSKYFDKVDELKRGDVVVWDERLGNIHGHIAICYKPYMWSFWGQNQGNGDGRGVDDYCSVTDKMPKKYCHYFRVKKEYWIKPNENKDMQSMIGAERLEKLREIDKMSFDAIYNQDLNYIIDRFLDTKNDISNLSQIKNILTKQLDLVVKENDILKLKDLEKAKIIKNMEKSQLQEKTTSTNSIERYFQDNSDKVVSETAQIEPSEKEVENKENSFDLEKFFIGTSKNGGIQGVLSTIITFLAGYVVTQVPELEPVKNELITLVGALVTLPVISQSIRYIFKTLSK